MPVRQHTSEVQWFGGRVQVVARARPSKRGKQARSGTNKEGGRQMRGRKGRGREITAAGQGVEA